MTIQITEQWMYTGIILLLIGIQIWQQSKIRRLYKEAADLWDQLSIITMTASTKFTELDIRVKDIKDRVDTKLEK